MANRLLERLADGPPLVADGGMGVLVSSAAPRVRIPEEANLRAPETVVKLHVGFIQAGADVIETNTFGANRRKLAANYLEDELHAINSTGVKLAREAREISGRDVFIAGSIGPLGEPGIEPDLRREIFAEQAAVLEGRGVDLFAVETFFELDELESAIEAVRSVSSLPVLAMLTFDAGAETLSGVSAARAAERLRELGVAAIGANHGAGIQAALAALSEMNGNGLPLAAAQHRPHPSVAGNRIIYPTPARVLRRVRRARSLGGG
jgi:homocysteine S-methyltransferase